LESRFLRPGKTIIATGAIALMSTVGSAIAAQDQAAPAQTPAAGQQAAGGQQAAAGQKNWKDRAEYDLEEKIRQTQDPKARMDLINQWQDKYPQSDYADLRDQLTVATLQQLAQADPSSRQMVLTKASDILKRNPKNILAASMICSIGPSVGGASPTPEVQEQVQTAAQALIDNANDAFDPAKKPANVTDEQFTKAKTGAIASAHNALAWVAVSKKDNKTAADQYKASLQANPDQGAISYQYGKMMQEDKSVPDEQKFPTVLWEYARASQLTGPGALPAAAQTQIGDYFKKIYTQFHGSADGMDQLMAQAKGAPLPPDGFTIGSAAAAANKEAEATNARIASDPGFKIWYSVKQGLVDQGDTFFNSTVKGFEIPGDSVPSKSFTGTVISVDPADAPTKVTLGIEDPAKADATLTFSKPLPAAALEKVKVGQKIDFSGIADSFTKDPYMLTFSDPTIVGVQTTAPAKRGRRK
jgi:hypothetical protein